MKRFLILLCAIALGCSSKKEESTTTETYDTITTASGLQYYYLKKGDGRKVEKGSKLDTKLSLMVDDSVVWTSYESEDSVFSFIAGISSVIKGFEEMAFLMREGDNVVAILPDSLAYGSKGAGNVIPPNATLVYDRYELVGVSEPKKVLSDTLIPVLENTSIDQMLEVYQNIDNTTLRNSYHMDQKRELYTKVLKSERFSDLETMALRFETLSTSTDEKQGAWYYQVVAMLSQGDTARAVTRLKEIIVMDPEESYWSEMLSELEPTDP